MSIATQTIRAQKILERKFTEAESSELLEYIETQHGELATKQDIQTVKQDIQTVKQDVQTVKQDVQAVKTELIKWFISLLFATITILGSTVYYLHNNTKQDMSKLEDRIEKRFDTLEKLILRQ